MTFRLNTIIYSSILVFLIYATHPIVSLAGNWKHRVQAGVELDNNVTESTHDPETASSVRLIYQGDVKCSQKHLNFSSQWSGGYQAYNPLLRENKGVGEYTLACSYRFNRSWGIGLNNFLRGKAFERKPIRYFVWSASGYSYIQLPAGYQIIGGFRHHMLDYSGYEIYDFSGNELFAVLFKSFSREWELEFEFDRSKLFYDRVSYVKNPHNVFGIIGKDPQTDQIQRLLLTLQHCGAILWKTSCGIEDNQSNSYSFSYQSMWVTSSFSMRIARDYIVRLYGMLQRKRYTERFGPDIADELDSESRNSNFLIFDISRNLSSWQSIFIRVNIYDNESTLRSYYYKKNTITIGSEFRM
ncbi:hypothetical protein JW960_18090 [candidate division KSB1 bacterium]|nr:hypothetical protein [candidate division KSB1 bacterium]